MTDTNAAAARARGQALRSARAARARTIRRRVISGAVALFVAAWLMITLLLVSGRDPALASHTSTTSSATTVASNPTVTTSSSGSPVDRLDRRPEQRLVVLVVELHLERRRREQRDHQPVMSANVEAPIEQREEFACFGSRCTVIVADAHPAEAMAAGVQGVPAPSRPGTSSSPASSRTAS